VDADSDHVAGSDPPGSDGLQGFVDKDGVSVPLGSGGGQDEEDPHGEMDDLTIPFLGDRWRWQYPFRSLKAAGAVLAMGSDWSVSTADPLLEMEVAVERVSEGVRGHGTPFLPDERLDLVDALAGFTAGSAYVNHLDDTGTIEVGKLADLTVLDRDLFDRTAGPIGDARVLGTFIEGVPVHEDPALDG